MEPYLEPEFVGNKDLQRSGTMGSGMDFRKDLQDTARTASVLTLFLLADGGEMWTAEQNQDC